MAGQAPPPLAPSVPHLVHGAAERYGEEKALSCILPNGWSASLTYGELDRASDSFAAYLVSVGVGRGDVTAIQAPNILSSPVALIGALKAGAVVSGVNPLYTPKETARQLEDCGAKIFVGFDVFGEQTAEVFKLTAQRPTVMLSASDIFPGVNTLFAALLEEPWFTSDLASCIELTFSGATALSTSVGERWRERTGSEVIESYGMTEATTVLTTNPVGEKNRPGTCGVPLPGTTIRLRTEEGEDAGPGQRSEVQAMGPQVMSGYIGAPELTEAAFENGWLKTGDVGVLDEEGYLRIVDRVKDMILVSGFNVYPGEIEEVVAGVPGVQEVGVVGRPDEKSGEVPVALVVAPGGEVTEGAIRRRCEEQLTGYKRAKEIRFVQTLPKSPVGKVLRRELRELLS